MFKRFKVMDLYHYKKDIHDIKEWIEVKDLPDAAHGIYKVRLKDGKEIAAYYFQDMIVNLMDYFKNDPSPWWSKDNKVPLYNVTHWGKTEND